MQNVIRTKVMTKNVGLLHEKLKSEMPPQLNHLNSNLG